MRIVKNEPHFICNVKNERFEFENDEWFFKSTGEVSYSIDTHDDVFDRNGKFIKEMIIDSKIEHETRNFVLNHDKSILQIKFIIKSIIKYLYEKLFWTKFYLYIF